MVLQQPLLLITWTSSLILNMLISMLLTLGVGAKTEEVVTRMSMSRALMPAANTAQQEQRQHQQQ